MAGRGVGLDTGSRSSRHEGLGDRREFISIIPNVGIRREFWGQPPGNRDGRYSSLIVDDLIAEAQDRQPQPLCPLARACATSASTVSATA
jgi:hypothetical protein